MVDRLKKRLIRRARRVHKRIFPCSHKRQLMECFTQHGNQLLFWFNTEDKTTHVLTDRIV